LTHILILRSAIDFMSDCKSQVSYLVWAFNAQVQETLPAIQKHIGTTCITLELQANLESIIFQRRKPRHICKYLWNYIAFRTTLKLSLFFCLEIRLKYLEKSFETLKSVLNFNWFVSI
jgi:predicted ferric reductase